MKFCLGIYDTDYSTFVNMLFILAKKYIYRCRVQETKVYFLDFKDWIFFIEKVEKHIAIKKDNKVLILKKMGSTDEKYVMLKMG